MLYCLQFTIKSVSQEPIKKNNIHLKLLYLIFNLKTAAGVLNIASLPRSGYILWTYFTPVISVLHPLVGSQLSRGTI